MSEGGLEGWKMQKHVQARVENGALAQCNVNEEQMQASVEVGETLHQILPQLKLTYKTLLK
jgi:hypothetical protein